MWVSDKRLYRTRIGKVVEAEDVRATDGAVLLCIPGDELPTRPVVEKLIPREELKAVKPAENKALKPGENKGKAKAQEKPEVSEPEQPSLDDAAPEKQE